MKKQVQLLAIVTLGCASALACSIAMAQDNSPGTIASSSADNTKLNERDKSQQTLKPTDQPNNSVDVKLAAAVRKAIVDDKSLSTNAHNVKLVAANGVVTLRGPVTSEAEKEKVGQRASSVTGVSKVDNQLDVKTN